MSEISKPQEYRHIIDALVEMCRDGQGQIGARRVREGLWNCNATPEAIADRHGNGVLPSEVEAEFRMGLAEDLEINRFLTRLTAEDREVLAGMLSRAVATGVFETLKVLEEFQIPPFEDGYESSPFNDFIGRLHDWEWPES